MSTKLSKQRKPSGPLHPRSRKATQLHRTQLRQGKLVHQKNSRNVTHVFPLCTLPGPVSSTILTVVVVDRVTWFQLVIDPEAGPLPRDEVHSLIAEYLGRFDEEIEQLKASQRTGRPKPKRLDELEMVRQQEREAYERTGFEMPDLMCAASVAALRRWDGTRESFSQVKMIRIKAPAPSPAETVDK